MPLFSTTPIIMKPRHDEDYFYRLAEPIIRKKSVGESTKERRFASVFGTSATVCVSLWSMADCQHMSTAPEHLLWALMLLKTYATDAVLSSLAGVDEKTFREWAWYWIEEIQSLELELVRNSGWLLSLLTFRSCFRRSSGKTD